MSGNIEDQVREILESLPTRVISQPYHESMARLSLVSHICDSNITKPNVLDHQKRLFYDDRSHRHSGILLGNPVASPLAVKAMLRMPDAPIDNIESSQSVQLTIAVQAIGSDHFQFPEDSNQLESFGITVNWTVAWIADLIERSLSKAPLHQVKAFAAEIQKRPYLVQPVRHVILPH